jgi:hypothetical protein
MLRLRWPSGVRNYATPSCSRDGVCDRALDLIIAATALENDLTLVTYNRADFADIPGPKLA